MNTIDKDKHNGTPGGSRMASASMPGTMQIGPYKYKVLLQNTPLIHDGKSCLGLCVPEQQEVFIKDSRGLQRLQQTFVHELLHTIHYYRAFEPSECDYDTIMDEFGRGFLSFAKNNPDLVRWLMTDIGTPCPELPVITEIPEMILIGIYQYRIIPEEQIIRDTLVVMADTNLEGLEIKFYPHRGTNMVQAALLMHIFGAIFDYRNFNPSGKGTELIVEELALGLLLFIKQNHNFMSWLINN
jgi:hypothetical protein